MTQVTEVKKDSNGSQLAGPQLLVLPSVDGEVFGPATNAFAAGATIAAGQAVILNSSSKWVLTDANTAGIYNGFKGIAMAAAVDDGALLVALPGSIAYITAFATLTVGTPYFLSETAGAITATMPTTGTSGQVAAGIAVHADMLYVTMGTATSVSGG